MMEVFLSNVGLLPAVLSVSLVTATVFLSKSKPAVKLRGILRSFKTAIEDFLLFLLTASWIFFLGAPYGALMLWRGLLWLYLKIRYGPLGEPARGLDIIGMMDSPKSRQILKSLKVLEGECELEDLRARCEKSMDRRFDNGRLVYRKFYQRLDRCGGYLCWKPSNFDIKYHVRYAGHLTADSPSMSESEALELLGKISNEEFEPGRAPWEILVIPRFHYDNESDDVENAVRKMALFIRIHHGIGDGFSLLKFILKDMAGEEDFAIPSLKKKQKRSWLYGVAVVLFFFFRGPRHFYWEMSAKDENVLHNATTAPSGKKIVTWSEQISLDFLKQTKSKLKSGMSTIMLSALAGSLKKYMKEVSGGVETKSMCTVMPVPAPNHPDDSMVNKFSIVIFPLSMESDDPLKRVEAIDHAGRELAKSPEAVMNLFLVNLSGLLPAAWARPFFTNTQATCVVSNVPGPSKPIYIWGRKLVDTMFWLPHLGTSGISTSFLSYGPNMRIGLTVDEGIIRDGREGAKKILDGMIAELKRIGEQAGVSTEGFTHPSEASRPERLKTLTFIHDDVNERDSNEEIQRSKLEESDKPSSPGLLRRTVQNQAQLLVKTASRE